MQITELPAAPDPFNDTAEEFGAKAAAFVAAQKDFVPEFNQKMSAFEASMNALAAGGAYALMYVVDTATAAADPGAGKLRLNSATQNAATALYVDTAVAGVDVSSILSDFGSSTSAVKGTIRLQQLNDTSKFLTFTATGVTNSSGYFTLTVVNTGGSAAAPFANGAPVMLFFQRTGDKGEPGQPGFSNMLVIRSTQTWTPPAGVTKAKITVVDGGYSGGTNSSVDTSSAGRGGNASISIRTVSSAVTYTATVGAGGVGGGGGSNASPSAGGASSFSGSGFTTLTSANGDLKVGGGKPDAVGTDGYGGGSLYATTNPTPGANGSDIGQGGGGTFAGGAAKAGAAGAVIIEF